MSDNALAYFFKKEKILSSYNGLVLFYRTSKNGVNFFISNPATQSCWPIPTPEHIQNYNYKIDLMCDFDGNLIMYHFFNDDWSSYIDCKVYSFKEEV